MRYWLSTLRDKGGQYVVAFVVVIVLLLAAERLYESLSTLNLERQDVSEWVEYHEIVFAGEDPEGRGGLGSLRMISDLTVHRPVDLQFSDILMCQGSSNGADGEFVFTSQNPDTGRDLMAPLDRRRVLWLYNADYPRGRVCRIDSTITATVDGVEKRLQVSSDLFTIRGTSE